MRIEGATCRCYKTGLFYQLVAAAKARTIRETLRRHGGNRTHAARALGIQRTYLIRLIRTVDVK
jgi:transcriptional regulator with PAS, ATPase and Fis domain